MAKKKRRVSAEDFAHSRTIMAKMEALATRMADDRRQRSLRLLGRAESVARGILEAAPSEQTEAASALLEGVELVRLFMANGNDAEADQKLVHVVGLTEHLANEPARRAAEAAANATTSLMTAGELGAIIRRSERTVRRMADDPNASPRIERIGDGNAARFRMRQADADTLAAARNASYSSQGSA